ncbi:MAG: hypothetical protein K9M81_04055 [Chthoniobacterales bacterium]|nr:hypothetical protein [Chthoniobacterales bacterium]
MGRVSLDAVTGTVGGAVGGAFHSAVGGMLGSTLGGAIRGYLSSSFSDFYSDVNGGYITGGAVGGMLGSTLGGAVGGALVSTLDGHYVDPRPVIGEAAYNYFAPNIAALKAWEAISDFRNRSNFAPQALDLLNKAQQQDHELQEKLKTVFKTIPEETKKQFLSRFRTELASDRARSTESAATTEGAPVDQLPQNFEQVEHILHDQIKKRIDARDILIEYLKTKVPET